MEIVAGLSLRNLKPRVWDPQSNHYLPALRAVMVSYADFHCARNARNRAMEMGLRAFLGVPQKVKVWLDNGAFYFLSRDGELPRAEYLEFVSKAKPDWYPVPQEHIPTPMMTPRKRAACLKKTMDINRHYDYDGFVPIAHVSSVLPRYVEKFQQTPALLKKSGYALGGIVPNLLRAPKAMPYHVVLQHMFDFRHAFTDKKIHLFGVGGTATAHLAALAGFDSLDSSGWRNRAARGIIQLPGKGDRVVADLGSWRGRKIDATDKKFLAQCGCPVCKNEGWRLLKKGGMEGFSARATHNLWVLLEEAKWALARIKKGEYAQTYERRLDNTIYLPLIKKALVLSEKDR